MANLAPNYTLQPRSSAETDRRHLLSESNSIAPSSSASQITDFEDGDRTPRAGSPVREAGPSSTYERRDTIAAPSQSPQPYRGFPSEAAYLAALSEWAEHKKYIYYDTALSGFYGKKTMQEYASQPGVELGLRKKWKARKQKKEDQKAERRNTVA